MFDISVTVDESTPLWPGTPAIQRSMFLSHSAGDAANDTIFTASLHVGTHLDFPAHYIPDGKNIIEYPLDRFYVQAFVMDCCDAPVLSSDTLACRTIPPDIRCVLFKTNNSRELCTAKSFNTDYVALDVSGAEWLLKKGITLVGIDYLSIEEYHGSGDVHRLLLLHDCLILESLHLYHVPEGVYTLMCLPLKIRGVEASPTRAVLYEI